MFLIPLDPCVEHDHFLGTDAVVHDAGWYQDVCLGWCGCRIGYRDIWWWQDGTWWKCLVGWWYLVYLRCLAGTHILYQVLFPLLMVVPKLPLKIPVPCLMKFQITPAVMHCTSNIPPPRCQIGHRYTHLCSLVIQSQGSPEKSLLSHVLLSWCQISFLKPVQIPQWSLQENGCG